MITSQIKNPTKLFYSELQMLMEGRSGKLPCVSIIFPILRTSAGIKANPIKAKDAIYQVQRKLDELLGEELAPVLIKKIKKLQGQIDFEHPEDGIGIFVSEDVSLLVSFPFPVVEKIVIGDRFVVRDLIYAQNYSEAYWVLALSNKPTRLFSACRGMLTEIENDDFPLEYEEQFEFPTRQRPGLSEYSDEESKIRDERQRAFFRHLDKLLVKQIPKNEPLVLLGIERQKVFFNEVSAYANQVRVSVDGNYDHLSPGALAQKVWPEVMSWMQEERASQMTAVMDRLGLKTAVSGLQQSWKAVMEGRGELLLIEKDFSLEAWLGEDPAKLMGSADMGENLKKLDDAVDELAKKGLQMGGEVFFVPNGALADHGGILLATRY